MSAKSRKAFLGLGANLGDRKENLRAAIAALGKQKGIVVKRVSKVYETAPYGVTDQPDFLNLVLEIESNLPARELLAVCKGIEREMGRGEGPRWGPRQIDIDILLLGEEDITDEGLRIPHPDIKARAFVMVPLAELEPELLVDGEKAAALAARLSQEQKISGGFQL